ncbi:hypothetical protein CONPUDRAFT_133484 [Coniophora puteana RWD-64-598 SS2]|uniref:Wax synthase domain-containing protein n=1 Tax=Coniophora puteana (strain RWD-64-598) TaxID=741705 RepID=R7SD28_CONPW|nr:uncharacterized protein CONPUDRAFT_133484 [Coniophora puteana RWD-64-598 SS2]EIW74081.1 hypothetical protein CONPUDRAFT_133484 [Coniophora puteana RWD-64-598 SS2]
MMTSSIPRSFPACTEEFTASMGHSRITILVLYYVMAVLVQYPGTKTYRIALLPLIFQVAFTAVTAIDCDIAENPSLVSAPAMFVIVMRTSAWTIEHRYLQRGRYGCRTYPSTSGFPSLRYTSWDALDLMVNLRNIGWVPGGKPPTYTSSLTTTRMTFLFMVVLRALFFAITFDVSITFLRYIRSDGLPAGSTIFESSHPLVISYLHTILLAYAALLAGFAFMSLLYSCVAFLGVSVLFQVPEQWPPLFDAPWRSTSLRELWSQRWHQLFQELFISLGSRPTNRVFGRPAGIIGAFLVSGVLHDVRLRGMGEGVDPKVTYGFFVFHGLAVIAEVVWKEKMKKDVGGWAGWVWTVITSTVSWCFLLDGCVHAGLLDTSHVQRISDTILHAYL